MNIMVIGGGGREHAIIRKLRENPAAQHIYALPGNGGIEEDAICVNIAPTDIRGVVEFAQANHIDFAVVAPDDPLVLGMVDALHSAGIACFGPSKKAAILEGSKVYAKNLMKKHSIPTAEYRTFLSCDSAMKYLSKCKYPLVVKADGLALGKGVLICHTREEGLAAARAILLDRQFGDSGKRIVVEEFLTGPEVSVLCFTDGISMVPMVSAMDHKRALDGDRGLNTGGMGAIAPNPYYTEAIAQRCMDEIFLPTMRAMNSLGRTFKGCLFFGLMLTEDGPKVIEYNCRFGDPETQVVLPLLKTDLLDILMAVEKQELSKVPVEWKDEAACCVMVVSGGYPEAYQKGCPIRLGNTRGATLYHSGTKLDDGQLVTSGGRVIGASATAPDLHSAIIRATQAAREVRFEGAYMRSDIGQRALAALKENG